MNPARALPRWSSQPAFPVVARPIRTFTTSTALRAPKNVSAKKAKEKKGKKGKKFATYKMPDLKDIQQYTLCDAMQYIKAFEVGREASVSKYDVAIRLKTKRDGPVLRNQVRLPWAVKTDIKVCVLVDPNSKAGKQAKAAGASTVGLDDVFEAIKEGKIDFDRCITTPENLPLLAKAGLPRILGPRGLMPSVKLGTVSERVAESVTNMLGGSTYRERQGVIRMSVGQLGFGPEQLRDNIKAFIARIKKEAAVLSDMHNLQKDIFEVVLSSTHSPGFSLNGQFRKPDSTSTQQLGAA